MTAVSGSFGEDGPPAAFRRAVESLRTAAPRPEVRIDAIRAPRGLAPFAFALSGSVAAPGGAGAGPDDDEDDGPPEAADGRLILLHDPDGHDAWQGTFRIVTLAQAELEQEMATDPLLPEVGWSWLLDALAARGCEHGEAGGTVSRSASHYFGELSARPPSTRIEIRASWTPRGASIDAGGGFGAHLAAWGDLLCTAAGLPPAQDGVVAMPRPGRHR